MRTPWPPHHSQAQEVQHEAAVVRTPTGQCLVTPRQHPGSALTMANHAPGVLYANVAALGVAMATSCSLTPLYEKLG